MSESTFSLFFPSLRSSWRAEHNHHNGRSRTWTLHWIRPRVFCPAFFYPGTIFSSFPPFHSLSVIECEIPSQTPRPLFSRSSFSLPEHPQMHDNGVFPLLSVMFHLLPSLYEKGWWKAVSQLPASIPSSFLRQTSAERGVTCSAFRSRFFFSPSPNLVFFPFFLQSILHERPWSPSCFKSLQMGCSINCEEGDPFLCNFLFWLSVRFLNPLLFPLAFSLLYTSPLLLLWHDESSPFSFFSKVCWIECCESSITFPLTSPHLLPPPFLSPDFPFFFSPQKFFLIRNKIS